MAGGARRWRQAIDRDAIARHFSRLNQSERCNATFGRRIIGLPNGALQARRGAGVDDAGIHRLAGLEHLVGVLVELDVGEHHPLGHLRPLHLELGVHARDDVVELRHDLVGKIQRAVLVDIHLGAGEDPEMFVAGVELGDGVGIFAADVDESLIGSDRVPATSSAAGTSASMPRA